MLSNSSLNETVVNLGSKFQEHYKILSRLGQGSSSQVYKALQYATGQEVAVKVLHLQEDPAMSTRENQLARFKREVRLYAGLYHPNIVRLIDFGESDGGVLYTVFAFVPGHNLAQLLKQEKTLQLNEAIRLMKQVLDALHCAHDCGIVHRDLKPDNIMIVDTGVQRNALILDFGIGSITATGPLASPTIPLADGSESLGAPAYAAPEQLRGEYELVSARSDLYSWGLIFLECLSGERLMDGPSLPAVLSKQLSEAPVPIPQDILDSDLGLLLQRTTEKDINQRDVTAYGLFQALEKLEQHSGLTADSRRHIRDSALPTILSKELRSEEIFPTDIPDDGGSFDFHALMTQIKARDLRTTRERRQITALCCELTIMPATNRELDIEEVDQFLAAYHAICVHVGETYNAYFASVLGHRVLFYFGYPTARQDNAYRAARSARILLQRIEYLSEELFADYKVSLQARIGVHTGLIITQDHGAGLNMNKGLVDIIGTTPNIAIQINGLAKPGEILISATAQSLLSHDFSVDSAGILGTSGSSRPMQIFRLGNEYLNTSASPTRPRIPATPMIGRTQEMALLMERWTQTKTGEGQSILITGVAGIGKSRLLRELHSSIVDQSDIWRECRCVYENRHKALHPFAELLERTLKYFSDDKLHSLEILLQHFHFDLANTLPLFADLLSIPLGDRYPPLEISAERKKQLTYRAILDLSFEIAAEQPFVIAMEDLHWADPSTLELLALLIEEISTAPLFAIFTCRPEFTSHWLSAEVSQLQLNHLTNAQVTAMMLGLSKGKAIPEEVVNEVVRRTNGVSLFVEELTNNLLSSDMLREVSGRYVLESSLAELNIPSTLRDLLTEKLDSLGQTKATIQLASALGSDFSYELIASISPLDKLSLDRELNALSKADLIHLRRSRRDPVYLFKHALIRDAAYESMSIDDRQQVHRLIATSIEVFFPELKETRPDLLAQHHAAANQKQRALDYALLAGKSALQRSANRECISHIRQALGWLDAIDNERQRAEKELALNGLLTPALFASEGYIGSNLEATTARSVHLLDFLGDVPQVFPTLWMVRLYHHMRSQRQQAREVAQRYVDLAEKKGTESELVAALPTLAQCLWQDGRLAEARALCERTIALYDVDAHHRSHVAMYGIDSLAFSQMTLGQVLWSLGYPEEAVDYSLASLKHGLELRHASTIGIAYLYTLLVYQYCDDRENVLKIGGEAIEFCEDHGLGFPKELCQLPYCWATGDSETAQDILIRHQKLGARLYHTYYRALIAHIEADRERFSEALELIEISIRDGESFGERFYLPALYRCRGKWLLQGSGDTVEAEKSFQQAIVISHEQGSFMNELLATTSLCQLWYEQGRVEKARAALSNCYPQLTEGLTIPAVSESRELYKKLSK